MILTITLNPSVDVSYQLDDLQIDTVNRVNDPSKTAGGKGLNVARVAKQLNADVATTGFLGGSLGSFIRSEITSLGIQDAFVAIAGETRNCIAIIHEGKQTEILESGPNIEEDEARLFLEQCSDPIKQASIISISGSLPKGLPADFYSELIAIAKRHGTRVILDVNGPLIASTLKSGSAPFLIAPNEQEINDLLGQGITSDQDIKQAFEMDLFASIPWVVVTQGEQGAMIKTPANVYKVHVPAIDAVNPVGSGDAVVAGLATGFDREMAEVDLIAFAMSMGVLNALEEQTGSIDARKVREIQQQVNVELL